MKTILTSAVFLLLSCAFADAQTTQTFINKLWEDQTGNPDTIDYAATTIDNHKHTVICGNTLNGLMTDILLAKYDGDGNLLWQTTYDDNGYSDYGTAITVDADDTIYIAGTVV